MKRSFLRWMSLPALLMALGGTSRQPDSPTLAGLASSELSDLQAAVKVVRAETSELTKISRDFSLAYKLKDLNMRYKEPNKLRMEGSIGSLIFNGSMRAFRVPAIKLNKKDDLGDSPGKRYNLMDIGILTPAALNLSESKYLRTEELDNHKMFVFEFSYKGDETAHWTLWVDPSKKVLTKRQWFDSAGKLKATFRYMDAAEIKPGIWVPTRLEIRNGDDVLAGVTTYGDLKVNQGLSDSLFDIS